jgi:periplasmic copper chaperone A
MALAFAQSHRRLGGRLALLGMAFYAVLLTQTAASAAGDRSISLEDAWSRATAEGADIAVGFVTIKNSGDTPDRLLSASAAFAEKTEIHETQMANGVMRMRPATDGVPIPAKGTVVFGPSGYHLMFMGLQGALKDGDAFPASLSFEHAGAIEVTFHVGNAGASEPPQIPQPGSPAERPKN